MTGEAALSVFRETIWMILKLAGPLLIISILIGLVIAIFQAATQIHEQTLTFVPKIVAIGFLLIMTGSWMLSNLTEFFSHLMSLMVGV